MLSAILITFVFIFTSTVLKQAYAAVDSYMTINIDSSICLAENVNPISIGNTVSMQYFKEDVAGVEFRNQTLVAQFKVDGTVIDAKSVSLPTAYCSVGLCTGGGSPTPFLFGGFYKGSQQQTGIIENYVTYTVCEKTVWGTWDCEDKATAAGLSPLCEIPPLACGNPGTIGKCSAEGGCDEGYICDENVFQCIEASQCGGGGGECIAPGGTCFTGDTCCNGLSCNSGTCSNIDDGELPQQNIPLPKYDGPILNDIGAFFTAIRNVLIPILLAGYGIPIMMKCGYTLMTSQGDPGKVKDGKECFTAAITGIIFILGALIGLRLIITSLLGISL